jgi:hypothetical protein
VTLSRRLSLGAGAIVATLSMGLGVTTTGAAARTVGHSPEPTAHMARSANPKVITVTLADNQQSYTLTKGNGLDVELSGPSGTTWSEPASQRRRT